MLRSALLFILLAASQASPICRALALEGGGSKGAYQAGALLELTQNLPGEDIAWNVVVGISTGALNSGAISMFAMGEEVEMAQFLKGVWLNLNGSASVYEDWNILGIPYSVFFESSLYNTQPLRNTLTQLFTRGIHRNVTIGASNLNTGGFSDFNETLGAENLIEAVMCSAAPPLFFPPQSFQGTMWADGGCIINLDVFSAINRCLDVVPNEEDIIVDMIFCSGSILPPLTSAASLTTSNVFSRVKAIQSYDTSMWYLYNALLAYPNVNFRYMIVPSQALAGSILPLDFDQANLEFELALGQNDTQKILNNGGESPQAQANQWYATQYNKARSFARA